MISAVLCGLIWTVQVVHYPLFARVGASEWTALHAEHSTRISLLVVPLMLAEVAAAAALVWASAAEGTRGLAVVAAACVALAWASTFFLSVPLHGELVGGFNASAIERLVSTNWPRTLAWTARVGVLAWMVRRAVG